MTGEAFFTRAEHEAATLAATVAADRAAYRWQVIAAFVRGDLTRDEYAALMIALNQRPTRA
jgi:hypothetical protein